MIQIETPFIHSVTEEYDLPKAAALLTDLAGQDIQYMICNKENECPTAVFYKEDEYFQAQELANK